MPDRNNGITTAIVMGLIVLAGCSKKIVAPEPVGPPSDLPSILAVEEFTVAALYSGVEYVHTRSATVDVKSYEDTVIEPCVRALPFADAAGAPQPRKRCKEEGRGETTAVPARTGPVPDGELAKLLRDPKARPVVEAFLDGVDPGARVRKFTGALFAFDSAVLRDVDKATITKALADFGVKHVSRALVVAHTDAIGSARYNDGLSDRRAESVSAYLEGGGVPAPRLYRVGVGEGFPVASNATADGRKQNRRARVYVYLIEQTRP